MRSDNFETVIDVDGRRVKILRDGHRARVPLMVRDSANPALTPLPRAVGSRRITDGSGHSDGLHRPGYRRLVDDAALLDAKAKAYAAYDAEIVCAYQTPLGLGGNSRRRGAAVTGSNEEGVCPDCGGEGEINGQTCQRCGGSGEINDYEDIEDDIVADVEIHTEGLSRNRTDNRSINQIMRDHQTHMTTVYAAYDRELSEAWR
jgi:hypothetical protein